MVCRCPSRCTLLQAGGLDMATVIKRVDMGIPQYFSLKTGCDQGSPLGGWISNKDAALQFARTTDAQTFMDKMLSFAAPFCDLDLVK